MVSRRLRSFTHRHIGAGRILRDSTQPYLFIATAEGTTNNETLKTTTANVFRA